MSSKKIPDNNHITYIEFRSPELESVKNFYKKVFKWKFEDFGEHYTAFSSSGVLGGFEKGIPATAGSPLIALYHDDLEKKREKVIKHGGQITQEIFSFPGGRRFEFRDPGGNVLAVWSDKTFG